MVRDCARGSIWIAALCICMACVEERPTDRAEVVAVLGEHTITLADLEDTWRARSPAEYVRTRHDEYELRRRVLDSVIAERLLSIEADRQGVSAAVLLERAVDGVPDVKEGDIEAVYEESDAASHGIALDEVRTIIAEHLRQSQREEAQHRYIGTLRRAADIRVALEPPREVVPVAGDDPTKGSSDAVVRIVEFSDFECPFCAEAWPTFRQLYTEYAEHIQWTWKDYPALTHEIGYRAAEAAQCAHEQGEFWAYHGGIFASGAELHNDTVERLREIAAVVNIDRDIFANCLESGSMVQRVAADVASGRQTGVGATPTLFINGRMVAGARPYETYERIVLEELELAGVDWE